MVFMKNFMKDSNKFISFPFEVNFFLIIHFNFFTFFCYVFDAALSFDHFMVFTLY